MSNFQVKQGLYTVPLDKLLELIEAQHLDISQISLANITADYLNYIKSLESLLSPAELSDFLVIATRLLLIKSKILIPSLELTEEEEGEIYDLELRLKIFQEFKAVSLHIQNSWSATSQIRTREFLAGGLR